MDARSYQQYLDEADDWLKRGRARLLGLLVERHARRGEELELLEVGAGAGQNLPTLARFGKVDAIEVHPLGREAIAARGIARSVFTEGVPFELDRQYDVICALDVIEHLPDDRAALDWMAARLRPSGVLVLTVPAYAWLFSEHDRILGHFRRYTRGQLVAALPRSVDLLAAAYFGHFIFPPAVAARAAWALGRRLRGGPTSKQGSPKGGLAARVLGGALDAELALVRRGYRPPFGLSVFAVARRAE